MNVSCSLKRVSAQVCRTLCGVIVLASFGVAAAQEVDWVPSPYGADDRLGAANLLTPAKLLEARDLMTTGQVYQLGRLYEVGIPLFGNRHFSLLIPIPLGPLGENETVAHEAIVSGEIGQVGTQFDGLGHIGVATPPLRAIEFSAGALPVAGPAA